MTVMVVCNGLYCDDWLRKWWWLVFIRDIVVDARQNTYITIFLLLVWINCSFYSDSWCL